MAKELPYFKFEPNQWENGNIQVCSHQEKGIFIELCSMYWSRLGDLSYKLAVNKICGGNATAIDSLYGENIIDIKDGQIFISFLEEQLSEFENVSQQNKQNALKGWEKRRKNATAKQPQSDRNAIREEEIKEEKKIIDNNIEERIAQFKKLLEPYLEKYGSEILDKFFLYWTEKSPKGRKMRFEKEKVFDPSLRLATWNKKEKNFAPQKEKKSKAETTLTTGQKALDKISQMTFEDERNN